MPDEPRDAPTPDPSVPPPPSADPHTAEPPAAPSGWAPRGAPERPLPRGCHPLVFGVVMATIEMAALLYFMPSCLPSCSGLSG